MLVRTRPCWVTLTLNGADAGNYQLELPDDLTASITPRTLIVNAVGSDKVYDGNTAATVAVTDNRVNGDQLNINYQANFLDANAASISTSMWQASSSAAPTRATM